MQVGNGKIVRVSGIQKQGRTATILLRGSNKLVLEEADRQALAVQCSAGSDGLLPAPCSPPMGSHSGPAACHYVAAPVAALPVRHAHDHQAAMVEPACRL